MTLNESKLCSGCHSEHLKEDLEKYLKEGVRNEQTV